MPRVMIERSTATLILTEGMGSPSLRSSAHCCAPTPAVIILRCPVVQAAHFPERDFVQHRPVLAFKKCFDLLGMLLEMRTLFL